MQNPLVSVIVPCYNQAQYLPEALDSVLAQTYTNWECIIVNDGSPDNTEEVAKIYCNKDKRFKYIFKENGGLSSARNAGMAKAKGQYIQFLDADDKISSIKFEKQVYSFQEDITLNICITNYYSFDDHHIYHTQYNWNNKISANLRHDILFRWDRDFSIPIHTALFQSDIITHIQFNEKLSAKEDWLFWIEITTNNLVVKYIDEELAFYRTHATSMSKSSKLMAENRIKVYFIVAEILSGNEKDDFLQTISNEISNTFLKSEDLYDEIKRMQHSKAYQLGKFILKPFSFLRHRIL